MRIALTGASGFIGRRLLAHLRQIPGLEIVCLARSPLEGVEWRAWSFESSQHAVHEALSGVQAVCHLAAHVPSDMRDVSRGEDCWRGNALATSRLLEAARTVGADRFLLCSSANILSRQGDAAVAEDGPIGCEHAPAYLGSKVMAEIFANAARVPGFRVAVIRPSSVYGPGMPERGAMAHFARQLAACQPVQIENPRYQTDFVWVDDVVDVIVTALQQGYDGTVNTGSGVATGLGELARELCRQLGQPASLILEKPAAAGLSPGFPALDISRARRELGYQPTPLSSGLSLWLASRS